MQYKLIDLAKIYFSKLTTSEYAAYIMIAAFFIILVYLVLIEMRYSILKGRIKKLCAKKDELESYLQNLNIEFENLLKNYNDLRERKSEVEKELDYINKQVDAKRTLLKDLEKEIVEIRKLKFALEGRIENLTQKLKDYSIEIKVKEYLFEKLKGFKARNLSHVFNILWFLMMFFFATIYYSSVHSKVPLIRSAYAEIAYLIGWALLWSFTLFVYKHSISAMNEALKNYEPCFDAIKHADEIENELRVYIDRKNALISITEEKAKKETDRTPKDEDRVVDVQPTKDRMKKEKSHEELRIQRVILLSECEEYERKIRKKKDEYERLVKNIGLLKREMEKLRSSGVKHTEEPSFKEIKPENIELISPRRANLGEEKLNKAIESLKAEKKKLEQKVESLRKSIDELEEENKQQFERREELKSEIFPLEDKRKEFRELSKNVEQLKERKNQLEDKLKNLKKEEKLLEKSVIALKEVKSNWKKLLKYFIPPDFIPKDENFYNKKVTVSEKKSHHTIWKDTIKDLGDIKNKSDRKLFESILKMPYVESIRIGEFMGKCKPVPKPIFEIMESQDQLNNNIIKLKFKTSNRGKGTSHIIYVGVKGDKSCGPCEIFTFFTLITLLSMDRKPKFLKEILK